MANVLPREKRLAVLAALVDGNSIRAAERMTGVHRDTVMRFGVQLGEGSDRLHNRLVRDLSCSLIDVDEQWGFVNTKTSNLADAAPADGSKGDAWTWVAIDRSSRMAVAYHVGKRDQAAADTFAMDLRSRLVVMPTLMTSDGLALYVTAILTAFGPAAPLAQTVKNYSYGVKRTPDHKYAQPHMGEGSFITKRAALGAPNLDLASTSKVEVNNLLARHKNGRMRRLCLAFSKSLRGHKAAASLFYTHYNFCHVLRTTRVTPALAAGVTDHLWSLEEFMDAVLDETPVAHPVAGPLTFNKPDAPARELPNGRGWLRVVQGGDAPSPGPAPAPTPAAPVAPVPAAVPDEPDPQLDLFAWRPKARPVPPVGTQLTLFGGPEGGDPLS
jgi:IS1 family transposase